MYEKEKKILEKSKRVLDEDIDINTLKSEYESLLTSYEVLLSDTEFLTRVSDRLHRKLNIQNDDLEEKSDSLEKAQRLIEKKNNELKASTETLEILVKERTSKLEEAYEDLLMANKELDNFAYKAHHDLKGPIARILGLCYVALRDVEDANAIQYFDYMYSNAELMQEIMRRLLSINKLRANRVQVFNFELKDAIDNIKKSFGEIEQNETVIIKFKHQDPRMYTDPNFFEVLMGNMLEYSLKNSTKPTPTLSRDKCEINLNFIEENQNLQIYITFTGEAIPDHLSKEIFELFHRTNRHPKHTGMELYTANLAARKLNGVMELISSTEQETVFSIFLPQVIES